MLWQKLSYLNETIQPLKNCIFTFLLCSWKLILKFRMQQNQPVFFSLKRELTFVKKLEIGRVEFKCRSVWLQSPSWSQLQGQTVSVSCNQYVIKCYFVHISNMLYFVIYIYITLLVILYTDISTLPSHASPTLNYAMRQLPIWKIARMQNMHSQKMAIKIQSMHHH